jgi:hypothetical protein
VHDSTVVPGDAATDSPVTPDGGPSIPECPLAAKVGRVDIYVDGASGVASDTNPGTTALPLKTISAALDKAQAGDTIWIGSHVYRETLDLPRSGTDAAHPISLCASAGAQVHIRGSDVVTGWSLHAGATWKRTGWPTTSQQVFIDGIPLQQIGPSSPLHSQSYGGKPILPPIGTNLGDMTAGSFWYDDAGQVLYVWLADGSAPGGHLVEASVRPFIIPFVARDFIRLHGLHFAHSNTTATDCPCGMVVVQGTYWVVAGCTFSYADFGGMQIVGEKHQFIANSFNHNGCMGIGLSGSDAAHNGDVWPNRPPQDILLQGNETSFNNYRGFFTGWAGGGIKIIPSARSVTLLNHRANNNDGPGMWVDGWGKDVRILNSVAMDNTGPGIFYEISDDGIIANNLVVRSAEQGIYVSASSHVAVFNNTVVDSWAGIVVHGEPRPDHPLLQDNLVINNLVSGSTWVDLVIYVGQGASNNRSDYNLYHRSSGGVRISWTPSWGYDLTHTSLTSFTADTGNDAHSLATGPMFAAPSSGDYRLQAGSPAIDHGTAPTVSIGALDLAGGPRLVDGDGDGVTSIDLGAFEHPSP